MADSRRVKKNKYFLLSKKEKKNKYYNYIGEKLFEIRQKMHNNKKEKW